jgi:eukaryotic-like serine/threonine-protein kinase
MSDPLATMPPSPSGPVTASAPQAHSASGLLESVAGRFEEAWQRGERPAVEDFLPAADGLRARLLLELVHADLELRLKAGEEARVEEYLKRYPELGGEAEVVRGLVAAEWDLRRRLEPGLTAAEYLERFPQLAAELETCPWEAGPGGPGRLTYRGRQPAPQTALAPSEAPPGDTPPRRADLPHLPGYELLEELGRGGMGVVYKALQVGLKRPVALKMILAGEYTSPEVRARFVAEAEAVARLRHPHIVQIHEIGAYQGRSYFSLEFCEGGSLDRRLAGTPQPPRLAAQLVEALAGAMDAAHEAGVVHRDLKPANVLLVGGPEAPLDQCVPKVTDFGLAKTLDSDVVQTRSGAVMGTPPYMAPEQAEGRTHDIGPWTDVYALGAILYELLAGRPPFRAATVHETLHQVCTREPVPPRQLAPSCPRDLETICLACLRKGPRRRYAPGGLAEDLRRFLAGEPIRARPVGRLERAAKWARRRPALALLAATAAAALLGAVTAAVSFGLYKGQEARAKALEAAGYRQQIERREKIDALRDRGKEAEAAHNYKEAADHYGRALAILGAAGDAPDELYRQIEGRLAGVRRHLQEQAEGEQARARLAQFDGGVAEVRFRDVSPTGRDQLANREQVRRLAPAALALVHVSADGPPEAAGRALGPFRPHLESGQRLERVAADCYGGLWVWAGTEPAAPPAAAPAERAERARRALRLLDTAAALARAHGLSTPQAFHLRRSRYLGQSGDTEGERQERERAAQTRPETAFDYFLAALEEYQRGRSERAAAFCEKVLGRQPDHFWAHYLQALCHLRAKEWKLAKAGLTACLTRRPGSLWPRLLRAVAHAELGEFDDANTDYGLALKQAGDDRLKRYVVLINRSVLHLRQRHWDDAVHDLEEARRLQPEALQAWTTLAQVHRVRQEWGAAVAVLTRALELQRENGQLWYTRAQVHRQRKDWGAARRDLEEAVARAPAGRRPAWLADAWVELGHLRHKAREYEAALAAYAAAQQVAPDYPPAHRQRAEALLALGRFAEAGEALDRYLAKGEPVAEVYQARGLIHDKLHEYPKAIESYGRALWLRKDAAVFSYRGLAYLRLGAARPALADFEAALRRDRDHADALCGRGHARMALGQVSEALQDAEAALGRGPRSATLFLNAACIYG